jgi:hypothetical protein
MSPLLLLLGAALAGPAYYHPDDVAARSARFAEAAQAMGPRYESVSEQLNKLGRALGSLEVSMGLMGEAAPVELRAWAQQVRKEGTARHIQTQRHLDLLQDDYGKVFGAALERALPPLSKGRTVSTCGGGGVAAMMGRKTCAGEDLNPALAAAIDKDAELARHLAEIQGLNWPVVELPQKTWAPVPVTGAERYLRVDALVKAWLKPVVETRQAALDTALGPLERGLEEADPQVVQKAQAVRARYDAELAADSKWARAMEKLVKSAGG